MQFLKAAPDSVADHVYKSISLMLKDKRRVVWVVSGGSTIPIAVDILGQLQADPANLEYLAVMQIDERFGPVGHTDSNWAQLIKAGFSDKAATFLPILQNKDLEATRSDYERILKKVFMEADYKIGLFGIGADGHTAGILPNTQGASEKADLVVAYEGPDYTRITISAKAIVQLDTVVAYATGRAKEKALRTLQQQNLAYLDQPAQILKAVKDSYIYNDILEGEI